MSTSTLLGIPAELCTRPLTEALQTDPSFQLVRDSRPLLAGKLREHELAAALLSPLDYAKESSEYCMIPNAAVSSRFGNASIVIRFREGIRHITTLAADPNFASEIVLAKIVLAESFEIEPAIRPLIAPPDVMLQHAEAALLTGDAALRYGKESDDVIDLVEEWNELTGLPFVHAIWCCREGNLTQHHVSQIQLSAIKGSAGIEDILLQFPKGEREAARAYLETFSYTLETDDREGLAEFMKYFYYHGIQPDVAELNFFKKDDENPFSTVSSN